MENVTATFQKMRTQQRINIVKSFGYSEQDIMQKGGTGHPLNEHQEEIIKGLQSDNPFEVQAASQELNELSEIQKSDIMEAIGYSEDFKIKKTGKEIKEQITTVLMPAKTAQLNDVTTKLNALIQVCGAAPTKDVCRYWCAGFELDIPYKRYDWEETRMRCNDDCVYDSLSFEHQEDLPKINCPQTDAEADARQKYNELVQAVCEIMVDIKACEILQKNLKDGDTIKLTPRQVVTFKFD